MSGKIERRASHFDSERLELSFVLYRFALVSSLL